MKAIVKQAYRFFKYSDNRREFFRAFKIKRVQNKLLTENFNQSAEKLIVFLVPGADRKTGKETMSGGVISIVSICEESELLFATSSSTEVILCTINEDFLLAKYHNFENHSHVFRFEQIVSFFSNLSEIVIHIPEYFSNQFYRTLTDKDYDFFDKIEMTQINILNQNINLMPTPNEIRVYKNIANSISITTAHQKYCTSYYRDYFGVPLHKLSVWISPEKYQFKKKSDKENLLIYSPDSQPEKEKIIKKLSEIEGLRLQMIKDLTYSQYKEVISNAKWALTFGEGLDGYFIEPIFSGAIGFAVYNEDFFTHDYKDLKTIYISYDDLFNNIVNDITFLDSESEFNPYQQTQYNIAKVHYSTAVYRENIKKFYNKDYTFK